MIPQLKVFPKMPYLDFPFISKKSYTFIFYTFHTDGSKVPMQLLSSFWNSSTTIPIVTRNLHSVPSAPQIQTPTSKFHKSTLSLLVSLILVNGITILKKIPTLKISAE